MVKLVGNWSDEWLDMSPFVVHFAKDSAKQTAYHNCTSILAARRIEARTRFGSGKNYQASPRSVCFSEIPLHHLSRLADERGPFGIGLVACSAQNIDRVVSVYRAAKRSGRQLLVDAYGRRLCP